MEFLQDLFVVGGIMFWGVLAVELCLLFLFTQKENGIGVIISVVGFCAILQFLCRVNLIGELQVNKFYALPIMCAYLLLGVGWAVFMWTKYINNRIEKHDEHLAKFVERNKLPADATILPNELRKDWACFVNDEVDITGHKLTEIPLVRWHKSRIIKWMGMWPFSLTLFLFKDMVTELFKIMYGHISAFLQEIANRRYAKAQHIKSNMEIKA